MNLMGVGIPELGAIFLVAFLVLGPGRSIDMARKAGKMLGDLRRTFDDLTSAVTLEADQVGRRPGPSEEPSPGVPVRPETPLEDEGGIPDTDSRPTITGTGSGMSESEERG